MAAPSREEDMQLDGTGAGAPAALACGGREAAPGQRNADNALPDAKKRRHDSTSDDATDHCHFQASWSARDPDNDDDGTWNMATARRGRTKQRPDAMKERRGLDQYVLSFRPKGRRAMADIPPRELHQQIRALAVAPETIKHLTVRVNDVSNTITITTYDRLHASRLRQLKELRVPGQPPLEVTVHQIPSRGMSRGVIRTLQTETEDTLKEALESESATILAARPMGKSLMALITFAAPRPPRTIKYWSRLTAVSLYVPRTLVCFRCHGTGHKQDICTKPAVCERCGVGHGSETICAGDKLHCAICDEDGHLATEPNCPEKARRLDKLKARTGRRSRSRTRRARSDTSKRPPTPSPERLRGEDYPPLPINNKDCQQGQRSQSVSFTPAASYAEATLPRKRSRSRRRNPSTQRPNKDPIAELKEALADLDKKRAELTARLLALEEARTKEAEVERQRRKDEQQQIEDEQRRKTEEARRNMHRLPSPSPSCRRPSAPAVNTQQTQEIMPDSRNAQDSHAQLLSTLRTFMEQQQQMFLQTLQQTMSNYQAQQQAFYQQLLQQKAHPEHNGHSASTI